jgi:hypothetical protein
LFAAHGQADVFIIQSASLLDEEDGSDVLERYQEDSNAGREGIIVRRIFMNHQKPD